MVLWLPPPRLLPLPPLLFVLWITFVSSIASFHPTVMGDWAL